MKRLMGWLAGWLAELIDDDNGRSNGLAVAVTV